MMTVTTPHPAKMDIIRRVEWTVCVLCYAVVLFLLVSRATHTGALWRDEASSLQLAQMPTWSEIARHYQFDSFPFLFTGILRSYAATFGASDTSMRCFGLAVGLGFLCVSWFHSRNLRDVPLLLPALFGLNTIFLTNGNWIRGYGLGTMMAAAAFVLTVRLLIKPDRRWLVAVSLAYLAAVQCLFFNIASIAAIAGSAILVCVVRRRWRLALGLMVGLAVCGLSYIPYLTRYGSNKDWIVILSSPRQLTDVWHGLLKACGEPGALMPYLWIALFWAGVIAAAGRLICLRRDRAAPEHDLLLFALLTSISSILAFGAFLEMLHHTVPKPRYFLGLLCVLAASIDLICAVMASRVAWLRLARIGAVVLAMMTLPFLNWPHILQRETNIDAIARALEQQARPNDLIVVNPWFVGVSFNRYYHGSTRWITVPEISDHRTHRYDLLKAKMIEPDPLAGVRAAVRETATRGDHVWLVGIAVAELPKLQEPVPPAPHPEFGWNNQFYAKAWTMQFGQFMRSHLVEAEVVVPPADQVDFGENAVLAKAGGWRD